MSDYRSNSVHHRRQILSLTLLERYLIPRDGVVRAGFLPARYVLNITLLVAAEGVIIAVLER